MKIANGMFCFSHGTRCAGAAASKANNGICGVGPAHEASIAGLIANSFLFMMRKSSLR